jgi:F-type H+-transporting ATPase subunit gamma
MAKARALDKRRRSIRNIRKITRTMELIANAQFKRAVERATAGSAYTERITQLVKELAQSGSEVAHPLLEAHAKTERAVLLILTSNRGMCAGYNASIVRVGVERYQQLVEEIPYLEIEVSGKRGISALRQRRIRRHRTYTHFEDHPTRSDVEVLANRYLDEYVTGELDRLDIVYTRFESAAEQQALAETLLPLAAVRAAGSAQSESTGRSQYEFAPSAENIIEEVVPTSFRVKLFKCFLDAAVSEHVARMVAMKAATENADEITRQLSMKYNRARQSQITNEIMEVIGGADALA